MQLKNTITLNYSSVDGETSNANNNNESGWSSVPSRCTTTTEDEEDGSGGVGGMSTVLPNNPSPEFDITSRDADVSNLAEETSSNNDTTPSVNPKVVQTFTGALTNEDVSIDLVNEGEEERENVNQYVDRERDKEKVVTKLMDVNDTAGDRESKESSSSYVIIIHVEERNKNTEEEKEKVKVVVEEVELDKKKIEEKNEKEEDAREVEKYWVQPVTLGMHTGKYIYCIILCIYNWNGWPLFRILYWGLND